MERWAEDAGVLKDVVRWISSPVNVWITLDLGSVQVLEVDQAKQRFLGLGNVPVVNQMTIELSS